MIKSESRNFFETYIRNFKLRQRFLLSATVLLGIIFCSIALSSLNDVSEDKVGRPLLFWARKKLDRSPELDKRIIIYAFSDDAVSKLGKPENLSVDVWKEIIAAISAKHPKTILIDMIFGMPRNTVKDAQTFRSILSNNPPVVTAAFLSATEISYRKSLNLDDARYSHPDQISFVQKYAPLFQGYIPYGPAEDIVVAAKNVGHISFRSPGWIAPAAAFTSDRILKHLSAFAADRVEYSATDMNIDGKNVPLNARGEALVNWSEPTSYYKRTFNITDLLKNWRNGRAPNLVHEGDIVIILPMFYTGNTDFKDTFVGEMPGGYTMVSMANSIITKNYLSTINTGIWGIIAALLCGLLISGLSTQRQMLASAIAINVLYLGFVVINFAWLNNAVTWFLPFLTFNALAASTIAFCAIKHEIQTARVHDALRGVVSPDLLKKISADPSQFKVVPLEKTITAMFIDFVGFSTMSEILAPDALFHSLKEILGLITDIIQKNGGIVDKTLGDGLLGFFGYNPISKETQDNHADAALKCAAEIQKTLALRASQKTTESKPIFAARIGLNTGVAYIGNIGEMGRIDLTVIGNTVNLAKRYEDAAEAFKIMVGPSTRIYLKDDRTKSNMTLRKANIKHFKEFVDAYEHDPFMDNQILYSTALRAYRDYMAISRKSDRILVDHDHTWEVWIDGIKKGVVIDHSADGLCVDLSDYFANRVKFNFDLKIVSRQDNQQIYELKVVSATVRWGRKSQNLYRHGLELSEETIYRLVEMKTNLSDNYPRNLSRRKIGA